MVQRQKNNPSMFQESLGGGVSQRGFSTESLRRIEELKHCGSIACRVFISMRSAERCLIVTHCERGLKSNPLPAPAQVLCPDHPVTGELFGKTGLVRQRVVGENRVVSWGAGAVGVLTGGWVLLEGHRQVQVLLSGGRSEVRRGRHRQII